LSSRDASGRAPYELRVPAADMASRDPRMKMLLWGAGSVLLGIATSYLLIQGEFRALLLLLLTVLGIGCLSPRRGVYILTAFLPFMYFIRRSVLHFQEFSQLDPVLLFPAVTTMAMCLGVLIFYGPTVFHYLRRSSLLKLSMLMLGVFVLEMFNPLQATVLVGLAGALYFIIPMLWLFFGLLIDREDMYRILKMVLVIGCITSVYGIYQHFFGLSSVEIYELESKHFLKTFGTIAEARVMSTFSGLVDFARYLTFSAFLAFAYFWRNKRNLSLLLPLGLQLFAMLYTASRTSFLVTIFSGMMLLILGGTNVKRIVVRGLAASVLVLVLYGYLYQYEPRRTYNQRFSSNPFVVHTLSGLSHPTEESSFASRLKGWGFILVTTFTEYPFGHGLGATTTAAGKFEGSEYYEADSYFFELFYGSGIVAAILFAAVAYIFIRNMLKMCTEEPDEYLYRVILALMCGVFLSSVFGVTPRDTITGPLIWMIVGWVIRADLDRRDAMAAATMKTASANISR
jgi:hypothetical protein